MGTGESLAEFDTLLEEHKQQKWNAVKEADRARSDAERSRDELVKETTTLSGQLTTVREELARATRELEQRKTEWNESVKRIQVVLEQREQAVVVGERALKDHQDALVTSQTHNRHQWLLLQEAVANAKALFDKHLASQAETVEALLQQLPVGTPPTS